MPSTTQLLHTYPEVHLPERRRVRLNGCLYGAWDLRLAIPTNVRKQLVDTVVRYGDNHNVDELITDLLMTLLPGLDRDAASCVPECVARGLLEELGLGL